MSAGALTAIEDLLVGGGEPDDVLRSAVLVLASLPEVAWAGIAFREEGELVLGPEAGHPDPSSRTRVPVVYEDAEVGELWVDGGADHSFLQQVARLVSPHVLIGWDTGGQRWEP